MRPWQQWTAGIALVVAAWGVALVTPPEDAREAPFPVRTEVGEQVAVRNLQLTVTDIHRADSVSQDDWTATGNWLVVDATAAATDDETAGAALRTATLSIGGRTFSASERVPDSIYERALSVGIPRSGSLAFELPADLVSGEAVLSLGLNGVPRLDSIVEIRIDLGSLGHEPDSELETTEWTNG